MVALPPLATTGDATAFGLTVTDAALLRASSRVRSFTGQRVSFGTSTVIVRGPTVVLPQRPVVEVTTVLEDGVALTSDEWALSGQVLELPEDEQYTVTYDHGWSVVPDEVVEVVCSVAHRLGNTDASAAAGVVQEASGSVSQTFGWDAWKGLSGLTSEEKAVLSRLFPRLPRSLVMRG